MSGWLLPTPTASLSLQEEEEEDIDNLVEIHRQRVARGSMRSGTSSVSSRCGEKWWRKAVPKARVGARQGRQLLEGRVRALCVRASSPQGNPNAEAQLSSRHLWPSPATGR